MKVLIADKISEKALGILKSEKSFEVINLPAKSSAKLADEVSNADALIVRSATKVTTKLLDAAARLRDRKSTRLNSSHIQKSRMPSSA